MITPRILAQGEFGPGDISVSSTEQSNRKIDPAIEKQIEPHWQKIQEDAKEKGKNIWNGVSCRVESLEVTPEGTLKAVFSSLEFKIREGLAAAEGYFSLSEQYYRKGAFVSSLTRTSDGYYVFVQLSGLSNNKNKTEVLGGIVGDNREIRSGQDLYEVMYQELREEAALRRKDIKTCVMRLVFLSTGTNIGFHFAVQLASTKEQVEKQFREEGKDVDIKDLLFVPEANLQEQMQSMGGYKPFLYETLKTNVV